jgi:serine/threonine-protein kinase
VQARFATSGHVIYVTADGQLHAVPFDQRALTVTGSPLPLIENVATQVPDSAAFFAVSEHGTLVHQVRPEPQDELVWVTRGGVVERMALAAWEQEFYSVSLSPDARQVAVSITAGRRQDVWTRSLETGATSRLTFDKDGSLNYRAKWTADGRDLSFISNRSGTAGDLWRQAADGAAPAERVVSDGPIIDEGFISSDGKWGVYRAGGSGLRGRDIKGVRLGAGDDRALQNFVATAADEYGPALSADGRWLAYVSTESGRPEVYVRPFPDAQRAVWQVSSDGGRGPLWARNGAELFFENRLGDLVVVGVRAGATFTWTSPQRLFSLSGFTLNPWQPTYDISPDGARFLMVRPVGPSRQTVVLTLNWFQELRQRFADRR